MIDSVSDQKDHGARSGQPQDAEFYLGLMRAYLDSANDGICVLCDEQKFLVANRTMAEWLGESEEALTAHNRRVPVADFLGPDSSQKLFGIRFQEAIAGKMVRFECPIHPPKGHPRWVEISMNRVGVENGDMVIAVVRDVTEQKMAQLRMEQQILRDDLTGLTNRRGFMSQLEQLVQSGVRDKHSHALLCLDLDQFKLVNDTCGHSAGDELLRQVAILLKQTVGGKGAVCRLGGDEFAVLLGDCDSAEAMQIAALIQQAFAGFNFTWQGREFDLAACIGVAPIDDAAKDSLTALMQADAACYAAKEKGRNQVALYTDSGKFTKIRAEMDWASRISRSLEQNRFALYFQNIVPLGEQSRNEMHHEILLRMVDAAGQVVAPAKFMPAAIKYNLMTAIDRWVIRHVFAAKDTQWKALARQADVAEFTTVNLSGASLNDDSFFDFLQEQIRAYNVPPSAVCFEITESIAVNDLERVAGFMAELKKLGFSFALDDFGSGVSSFSYLKALPVDFIKIDGGLVREITHSALDRRIIESIVFVAREMGVKTIAEYVESQEIRDCLKGIGVDYVQGYAIHCPEPLAVGGPP